MIVWNIVRISFRSVLQLFTLMSKYYRLINLLQNYIFVEYKNEAIKLIKRQLFITEGSKSNSKEQTST